MENLASRAYLHTKNHSLYAKSQGLSAKTHSDFLAKTHSDLANQRSVEALLNCYCRDVAAPASQLRVEPLSGGNWPQALHQCAALSTQSAGSAKVGGILLVQLPEVASSIAIAVQRASASLNFRYLSAPYHKRAGQGWKLLDYRQLATLLLETLAQRFDQPFNAELYRQILNSAQVMQELVSQAPGLEDWGQGAEGYVASEQALTFGHAFHPTPKSREGFSPEDTRAYSPEVGAAFQLEYIGVRTEDLLYEALAEQVEGDWIAGLAPPDLDIPDGFAALPLHPWQAGFLRRQGVVREALASGRLRNLGTAGEPFHPTASVRTLYRPGCPYFYKFSLHMRLTNCVRKNACYELESAVGLSRILSTHLSDLGNRFPDTHILYEPAFVSAHFADHSEADQTLVTEGFGLLLRQGLNPAIAAGQTPLLAAALFQHDLTGASPARRYVTQLAQRSGLDASSAALAWFDAYLERVLEPVLYCYFQRGVVFEPHLQNVVISLRNGLPHKVFLRDLEGTKLVRRLWSPEQLARMSERARASVYYDEARAWGRIAYCLLANNLFQAIFHLSGPDARLEQRLWQRLRERLAAYQARFGCAESQLRIGALLKGEALPYKTNLLTRVFKRADRDSQYVPLDHPLGGF